MSDDSTQQSGVQATGGSADDSSGTANLGGVVGAGATPTGAGVATGAAVAGAGTSATTGSSSTPTDIVADKNKSAEQYILEAENLYIIPKLVRGKFPDIIKLIYETESMDKDEREYWLQIMPIMSEDQLVKLKGILVNEKEQLAKLDKEYEDEMARIDRNKNREIDEVKLKKQLTHLKKSESQSEQAEKTEEENLLSQLEEL